MANGLPLCSATDVAKLARFVWGLCLVLALLFGAGQAFSVESTVSIDLPSDGPNHWGTNIGWQILKLEAEIRPDRDSEKAFQTLRNIVDDCCAAVCKISPKPKSGWNQRYAVAVLKSIDLTLINRGFVYPDDGGVDLLTDALTPVQMAESRRSAFEIASHNRRRIQMIAEKFPGPFFAADCDTASFIYLAVADRLNLPLRLVQIPSFNRHAGHTFIRWREGSHSVDWETMDGIVAPEGHFKQWRITKAEVAAKAALADLDSEAVMGCAHHLVALQCERRHESQRALSELSVALKLNPLNLDARREFAWLAATSADSSARQKSEAIEHARFVLRLVDDPDAHDTLAAGYASVGRFDEAVKEEKAALLHIDRSPGSSAYYQQRLQSYKQNKPFYPDASTSSAGNRAER